MRKAPDNSRKSLHILRERYVSKRKLKIFSLHTQLTSLWKTSSGSIIRAENATTSIKPSGELINDSLLIFIVLKGFLFELKSFTIVITQKDKTISVNLKHFVTLEKLKR